MKADQHYVEPTPKIVTVTKSTPKEPKPTASRYQGVYVSRESLKRYLEVAFTQEGLESEIPLAEAVIACESGFRADPPHNGISWGVAQFTPPTWKDFGYGDIMNPISQLQVMAKMWSRGLQNRWDCYKIVIELR